MTARWATGALWCTTATVAPSTCRFATPKRLAEAGIEPSVGRVGDSYDNALAESIIALYKTDVIRQRRPLEGMRDLFSEWAKRDFQRGN